MTAVNSPVVVLLGGPSAEHDVSIVSGNAVADALGDRGHPVARLLIDLDGGWWRLPAAWRGEGHSPADYDDPAAIGATGPESAGAAVDRLAAEDPAPVVFIALHGPFGEDGTVQAILEAGGLAYTGSGVTASALGMDKAIFKRLCRGLGLPVADWREVRAAHWTADRDGVLAELEAFAVGTGDPRLMVKPARLGSSVGMTLAHDAGERPAAIEAALAHDSLVLAEAYLAGARDLEVSVIGNDPSGSSCTVRARSSPATSSTTTPRSTPRVCPKPRPPPRSTPGPVRRSSRSPGTATEPSARRVSRGSTSS